VLAGACWVKKRHDEAKKSRAEKDNAEGVEEVCKTIAPILDEWEPDGYETEDEYVEDLFDYLVRVAPGDYDFEMFPSTHEGKPDILVDDLLAIEVKCDLSKAERDRLIGQTAAYSRAWVTWIALIDTQPVASVRSKSFSPTRALLIFWFSLFSKKFSVSVSQRVIAGNTRRRLSGSGRQRR
jgi:hypothetical protein